MSTSIIQNKIEKAVMDDSILSNITNDWTHVDIHTDGSIVGDLDRIFLNHKNAQSRFIADNTHPDNKQKNQKHADFLIQEGLLYRSSDIANWLSHAKHGEKGAFQVPFPYEDYGHTGVGIIASNKDNSVREYATDSMTMVLRKDAKTPLGFTLVTAYPNMENEFIQPTGRNLSPFVKETEAYKQADTVGKTYLEYITTVSNQGLVTYKKGETPNDSMMMIHAKTNNPNVHHEIKVKENDILLRTVAPETDEFGDKHKKVLQTEYTRGYAKAIGVPSVQRISLTNNRMFKRFQSEYPVIATQLSDIRNQIITRTSEKTDQMPKQPIKANTQEIITKVSHQNNRGQMANDKFGHILDNHMDEYANKGLGE